MRIIRQNRAPDSRFRPNVRIGLKVVRSPERSIRGRRIDPRAADLTPRARRRRRRESPRRRNDAPRLRTKEAGLFETAIGLVRLALVGAVTWRPQRLTRGDPNG
eukprot:1193040-Prorocentrum_minimum.AAC.1